MLGTPDWPEDPQIAATLQAPLLRLCAKYLAGASRGAVGRDRVAKFHLGNGARLEPLNWLGKPAERGIAESYGVMGNYLYDLPTIEANHEAFVRDGRIAHSNGVDSLLHSEPPAQQRPLLSPLARLRG